MLGAKMSETSCFGEAVSLFASNRTDQRLQIRRCGSRSVVEQKSPDPVANQIFPRDTASRLAVIISILTPPLA